MAHPLLDRRGVLALVAVLLGLGACAGTSNSSSHHGGGTQIENPRPSVVPTGSVPDPARAALDEITSTPTSAPAQAALDEVRSAGDVRLAWPLVDLLRFHQGGPADGLLTQALADLTDTEVPGGATPWVFYSNLLLTWDIPAPPDYFALKRGIYVGFEGDWSPFFDETTDLDWRQVTWGGVRRDAIAQLNDPETITAPPDGGWLPDEDVVFGVEVGGESRAYPQRVMDVHEMVNDTLGGRRIALAYCTLCGAAIGYLTDDTPEGIGVLELRTSGLLERSNKLMYDVGTESLFDQFKGAAVTGSLADRGVVLNRFAVVTTTWGAWRNDHPETSVVSEDGGVGRVYVEDPLGGRDDNGPIFPIGPTDDRLGVQDVVLGVVTPDGSPLAFDVEGVQAALDDGETVELAGVEVVEKSGGLAAHDAVTGGVIVSHQAYWFAWSQFNPDTLLWVLAR